jgi:hypothetical protein
MHDANCFVKTASATTAGLVAYIKGLGLFNTQSTGQTWNDVVADLKTQIEDWSWERIPGQLIFDQFHVSSIWNNGGLQPCSAPGGSQNSRRATLACPKLTCEQQRPAGAPSGDQVANALTANNQIASICGAKFDGSGNSTYESFNHGEEEITVQRGSDTEELTFCTEGLDAIITGCITNGGDYGGTYTRGDQKYTITNLNFPNNPLLPSDDGGDGLTTCQQSRPQGAPSGQQIANALTGNNALQGICAAKFDGSGDSLHETFNHGLEDITVERSSDTEALTFCIGGLNSIITTCILNGNDYGGTYVQGGETYTIWNQGYPQNPLLPGEPGGPALTTTPPTTTQIHPAQTVTINCQVCVLPFGSNDPFCSSIPGCTPTTPVTVTTTAPPPPPPPPPPKCITL